MREGEERSRTFAKQNRRMMPRAEAPLWSYIRKHAMGVKFRRQHPIGPYIADFACVAKKMIIEVDGHTHWTAEELAHGERRTKYLKANGWRIVRVTNPQVYDDLDGVWSLIAASLKQGSP